MKKLYFLAEKDYLLLSAFLSFVVLCIVYFSEFYLNLPPCQLCKYQRFPYVLIILTVFVSFLFQRKRYFLYSCFLLFFLNLGISLFHSGIERNLITFNTGCNNSDQEFENIENLKNYLEGVPITKCNEIIFSIIGLSFANLNVIFSLLVNIFNFFYFSEIHERQKKKNYR